MAHGELRIQEAATDAATAQAIELGAAAPRGLFHSFRYRDFALFWTGACLSNVGTWMQMVAQSALIYALSGSTVTLGVVAFAAQVPMVLLTLVGGSLADRLDRRRMLLVTQAVMASTAVALAVLAATGAIRIWHILVIAVINGTANGITIPTFQAMVGDLVPREARGNAIALNSAQFHLSRSIGPALAAGLFALVQDRPGDYGGSALCFAANALSFGAVIGALLLLRHRPASVGHLEADWRAEARRFQAGLLEALGYLRAHPGIELLIHLTAITAFFGMPLVALLPAYAKDVVVPVHPLSAPAQIQGHLMTASGIGAVIGAVGITSALRKRRPIPVTLLFALLYGVTVGATGLVAHEFWAWIVMALVGLTGTTYTVMVNTQIQTSAPDQLRGRLMAIYTLAFLVSMALGNVLTGWVARGGRVPFALGLNGVLMVLLILVGMVLRRRDWDRAEQA